MPKGLESDPNRQAPSEKYGVSKVVLDKIEQLAGLQRDISLVLLNYPEGKTELELLPLLRVSPSEFALTKALVELFNLGIVVRKFDAGLNFIYLIKSLRKKTNED